MSNKKGYNRYQLSSPFEGSKIYETRSLTRAAKKIYKELINGIKGGKTNDVFSITDIDNKIEYNFRINGDTCDDFINETIDDEETPTSNVVDINRPLDQIPKLNC